MSRAKAAIEEHGILLVYPLNNRVDPRSLWSVLHPRTPMRWAWDEGADRRVAELWHLREELARGREVVYTKWFQGRATFFSRQIARAVLSELSSRGPIDAGLSRESRLLLEVLEDDSPKATKALREAAELRGKENESTFARAMKALWSRLLVVGVGEVAEGGFPSLSVGATKLLFEDVWNEATGASEEMRAADAAHLAALLEQAPSFAKELRKARAMLTPPR